MASIRLDAMLRDFTPELRLTSRAETLEGVLDDLEARFPRLRGRLRNELGALRPFVRVFLNGEPVDPKTIRGTVVQDQDAVDILHSIQGG